MAGACFLLVEARESGPAESKPSTPPGLLDSRVIATVDGAPITSDQLTEEMMRRARLAPGLFDGTRARRDLLDERIRFETLVARARAAGYERDPELSEQWKRLLVRRYQAERLEARFADLRVSMSEIEQYYETNLAEYTRPERRRLALIFMRVPARATPERLAVLTHTAENILREARTSATPEADFAELARTRSDDRASRYVGGNIGWLSAGRSSYRWQTEVVDAMFALSEPGDLSPIVRAEDGLYLLRLSAVESGRTIPLPQIEPTIRHLLLDAKRKELSATFYAELAEATRIEIDYDALDAIQLPAEVASTTRKQKQPPPLPGG